MQLAEFFKALGEPVRLRLFSLIATSGEQCVCHLTEALELPQSTISRHLGVLRHAGLVYARRDGKWMYYQLADDVSPELIAIVQQSYTSDAQFTLDTERLSSSRNC
ncbi:ArsR family transcriptional regulator [Mariprofundus micogutta]|uniref:ArsR family transcriptional regulator n=1 Tax=Mariprofundus micogutta TaxID=1921010 RepID=A0A1L8CMK7_9PROT|nr:metalloregulator ArsR/SmtB family transcription factor [Mariprofundus micogutta]GAV20143.1 ArsR family transcriptional regulator [Mariprofundus micogutta]